MSLALLARYGLTRQAGGGGGSTFFTDFGEYTPGSPPGDWTGTFEFGATLNIVSEAGTPSGKHLDLAFGSNATQLVVWDTAASAEADFEILAMMRYQNSGSTRVYGIFGRGDAGSVTAYVMGSGTSTAEQGQIYRAVGSNASSGLTEIGSTFGDLPDVTWGWWRFRVVGTTLYAKAWADGDSEPGSWMGEETDANISGAGSVGIALRDNTSTAFTFQCAYFAVAFGGGTAPGPA